MTPIRSVPASGSSALCVRRTNAAARTARVFASRRSVSRRGPRGARGALGPLRAGDHGARRRPPRARRQRGPLEERRAHHAARRAHERLLREPPRHVHALAQGPRHGRPLRGRGPRDLRPSLDGDPRRSRHRLALGAPRRGRGVRRTRWQNEVRARLRQGVEQGHDARSVRRREALPRDAASRGVLGFVASGSALAFAKRSSRDRVDDHDGLGSAAPRESGRVSLFQRA